MFLAVYWENFPLTHSCIILNHCNRICSITPWKIGNFAWYPASIEWIWQHSKIKEVRIKHKQLIFIPELHLSAHIKLHGHKSYWLTLKFELSVCGWVGVCMWIYLWEEEFHIFSMCNLNTEGFFHNLTRNAYTDHLVEEKGWLLVNIKYVIKRCLKCSFPIHQ